MKLNAGLTIKCLQQCKTNIQIEDWGKFKLPSKWKSNFASLIYSHLLDKTSVSTESIRVSLKKHVVANNVELNLFLQRIYLLMSGIVPNNRFDTKSLVMYAEKLNEGLSNCTEGLYNRVSSLWRALFIERNSAERLETIREQLVDLVGMGLYDEVHAQNSVTVIASKNGFGITSLNPNDPYRGNITESIILENLEIRFKLDYTPINIIISLEERLFSQFNAYDYTGKRSKDNPYKFGEYGNWDEILKARFPNKTDCEWYILEEALIVDLNWPLIRRCILQQLQEEDFFSRNLCLSTSIAPGNTKEERYYLLNLVNDEKEYTEYFKKKTLSEFILFQKQLSDEPKCKRMLADLIHSLSSSPDTQLKKLFLTRVDDNGSNGLMIAINELPSAVPELFHAINGLDDESKKSILTQTNRNGLTVLMMAIKDLPNAVPELLKIINGLDKTSKNRILASVGYSSCSRHQFSVKYINGLDEASKKLILTQVDSNHSNAFSNGFLSAFWDALNSHQSSFEQKKNMACQFINDINLLGGEHRATLLTQTFRHYSSNENLNALMMVSRDAPDETPKFLEAINQLDKESKRVILAQSDKDGSNALMFAARVHRRSSCMLTKILIIINSLDKEPKKCILTQTDRNGLNALMIAIKYYSINALPELLEAINGLDDESKKGILTQTDSEGYNALMIATQNQYNPAPKLLEAIRGLDLESKRGTLTQINNRKMNALMIAIHYKSDAVPEILKAIDELDNESKKRILTQTDSDGWNTLIIAFYYNPSVAPKLIEAISGLDLESRKTILTQTANCWGRYNGWSLLMIAIKEQPGAVPDLLKAIYGLDLESKKRIVTQTDSNGLNALIIAIKDQPGTVPELLKALDNESKGGLLTQTDSHGLNALMIAITYNPSVAPKLIEAISGLDLEYKKGILTQTDGNGLNALMIAIKYNPSEAPKLIEAISGLDLEYKKRILTQTDLYGANTLIIAFLYNPSVTPKLIEAISGLDDESKKDILTQTNNDGLNALILASSSNPSAVPILLNAIDGLDDEFKIRILTQTSRCGSNALMFAILKHASAVPILLEAINRLDEASKKDILTKVSSRIFDRVTTTLTNYMGYVPSYLTTINSLNDEYKRCILTPIDSQSLYNFSRALQIAIRCRSKVAPELLKMINVLDDDAQKDILVQTATLNFYAPGCHEDIHIFNENALMIAIKYQPSMILELLKAINRLNDNVKKGILAQTNTNGLNALMIAIKDQPFAIPKLLEAVCGLGDEFKRCILTQTDSNHLNVLMIAYTYTPNILPELFKAITRNQVSMLTPYLKPILLKCQSNTRYQPLLIQFFWHVAGLQPRAVPEFLRIINNESKYKYTINWFATHNKDWNTALMFAVQYQARELPGLLNTINDSLKDKNTIKDTINRALEVSKLERLTHSQLIDILKSIKNSKYAKLFIRKILNYKDKFLPQDWYTIVKEELLSAELIDVPKTNIYTYLVSEDNTHRNEDIAQSLNINTSLGKFFQLKYGFFSSSVDKEILKQIKALAIGNVDAVQNSLINNPISRP